MMTGPRRQFSVSQAPQFAAQRLLRDAHPELLEQPLAEIDDPPADDTMDGRRRAALDHLNQGLSVFDVEQGWFPRSLPIDQPVRAVLVELLDPVADDLHRRAWGPSSEWRAAARVFFTSKSARRGRGGMAISFVRHVESVQPSFEKPPGVRLIGLGYNPQGHAADTSQARPPATIVRATRYTRPAAPERRGHRRRRPRQNLHSGLTVP